jgi:hypothetical protein
VLIDLSWHDEVMFGVIVIAVIVALGVLVYTAGVDSRIDDVERRRRYNG